MQSLLQKCVCMDMIIFRSLYLKKKDDRKHTEREEKKKEIDYPRYFFITKNERRKEEKAYIFPYDGIDSSL
jgi:hypothetical protein